MNRPTPAFADPLAPTGARLGPTMILPGTLKPGEIMALSSMVQLLAKTDRKQFAHADPETLAACTAGILHSIHDLTGRDRPQYIFSDRPTQTYPRLLQMAAICILQAEALASEIEATAQNVALASEPAQLPADSEPAS